MAFFPYGSVETSHLSRRDRKLGAAIERLGKIERPVTPDPFTALIQHMVAQQISTKAFATVWNRVEAAAGTVTPASIAALDSETLRGCGMSLRKAGYIHGACRAALTGEVDFTGLATLPDKDVIATLSALPGVGVWTAEMLLIFSLLRPDVVSWGDLAIRRGMMTLYGLDSLSREGFATYARRYSPYGSTASLYLWKLAVTG